MSLYVCRMLSKLSNRQQNSYIAKAAQHANSLVYLKGRQVVSGMPSICVI